MPPQSGESAGIAEGGHGTEAGTGNFSGADRRLGEHCVVLTTLMFLSPEYFILG